jgi:phosphohistidine phosphatase SixA
MRFKSTRLHILLSILFLVIGTTARAQNLEGAALVRALERGGYVVVMRHASSPSEPPAKDSADAENTRDERQLDEKGRTTATAMGKALHDLKILLGEVLSSPTYRALETVRYAQLGTARTYSELGDNGKSMQGGTEAQAHWLQHKITRLPSGTNTFIVTHNPNIMMAFPLLGSVLADGEALVFGPDGKGGAIVVARIKIEEWPSLRP